MREIKFRGLTKDGSWAYGLPHFNAVSSSWQIVELRQVQPSLSEPGGDRYNNFYEVDPKTIGQYTGLKAGGKEIYEGDIIYAYDRLDKRYFTGYVSFRDASFVITDIEQYDWAGNITHYRWMDYECEKIGNIHETPELL